MNKLKRSTAAKVIALLLLALFIPATVLSFFVTARFIDEGVYNSDETPEIIERVIDFDLDYLADSSLYYTSAAEQEFRMQFARDLCGTVVTVKNPSGITLLNNYTAEIYPSSQTKYTLTFGSHSGTWVCGFSDGHDNPLPSLRQSVLSDHQIVDISFKQWLFDTYGINTYGMADGEIFDEFWEGFGTEYNTAVHTSVHQVTPIGYYNVTLARTKDSVEFLSSEYLLLNGVELRWWFVGIAAGGLVLTLLLMAFLCFAAGWQKEGDRPTGTWFERIPLGIFLVGSVLAVMFLSFVAQELSYFSDLRLFSLVLFGLAVYALVFTGASLLHSLVARIKCKGWQKHTIVYHIFAALRWVFENLSSIWMALVCVLGWVLINFLLTVVLFNSPGIGLVLLALFNLAAAAGIIAIVCQWQKLSKAAAAMASGDTDARIDTSGMLPPLRAHGNDLNRMGEGVSIAVEERMRSERMKTDLITNVSHDLKTPLTSIVSYVGLLKGEHIDNPTAREYIDTLDRQAVRLGRLIEDLVEASKVTSGSIKPELTSVNVGELLEQAVCEYDARLASSDLTPVLTIHGDVLTATADGRLLWRVFDNLLSNACKYAMPGTRLYIDAAQRDSSIGISFRNISVQPLNIPADELMERFVRGDSSRTTSGSGLGLTIARTLTELQGGTFSLDIDGDLFKAYVVVPAGEPQPVFAEEEDIAPADEPAQDALILEPLAGENISGTEDDYEELSVEIFPDEPDPLTDEDILSEE